MGTQLVERWEVLERWAVLEQWAGLEAARLVVQQLLEVGLQ